MAVVFIPVRNTTPPILRDWLAVATSSDGTKIVLTDGAGVWLSTDTGGVFTETTVGTPSPDTGGVWEALVVAADGSTYYGLVVVGLGQSDLFSSSDAASWSSLTTGSAASGVGGTGAVVSSDKTRLAFSTNVSNVIYLSSDSGLTWGSSSILPNGAVSYFIAGSSNLETLVVGVGANPTEWIAYSSDFGTTWSTTGQGTSGADGAPPVASSGDGATLTAIGAISSVATTLYSTNGGSTWNVVTGPTGINCDGLASASAAAVIYAADFSGTVGILKSTDGGATWGSTGAPTANLYNAVATSSDGSVVCAVTQGQGVWVSTDSGATWAETAI